MKKKVLVAIILTLTILFGIKSTKVLAQDIPYYVNSFISFYVSGAENGNKSIYRSDNIYHDTLEGVTYDKSTNTLTLNNLKTNFSLAVSEMGEDFKINLIGENEITDIFIFGAFGGNVQFIGDGSLTINKDKTNDIGIYISADGNAGKIEVDDTVTLKVYGSESAIEVANSSLKDNSKVIIFNNGDDISDSITTSEEIHKEPQIMNVIIPHYNGDGTDYIVAIKDGKKYGISRGVDNYYLTIQSIICDYEDDICFLDPTSGSDSDAYNLEFASLEAITEAGYEITDEVVPVNYWVNYSYYLTGEDNNGVKYAYTESYYQNEIIYYVYNITNNVVTLNNGREYTVVIPDNEIDGESLVELEKSFNVYSHVVNLKEVIVLSKDVINEEIVDEKVDTEEITNETINIEVKPFDNNSDNDKVAANAVNELLEDTKNDGLILVIKESTKNGHDVLVQLDINKIDANEDIKKQVEDKIESDLNGAKILGYFDINLLLRVDDNILDEKVTELNNEILVKLDVSDLIRDLDKVSDNKVRKYYVIRIHDGKTDIIEATLNDNILFFKSDKFSSYIVTYKDIDNISNPKTLDNINVYVIIGTLSLISLIVISLYLKRNN